MSRSRLFAVRHCALIASTAVLLASCGGGDEPPAAASASASGRESPQGFFPGGSIPSDAHLKGMWSPVYTWPLIPIHAVLMPDGRVMSYGATSAGVQTGFFSYDIWDGAGAPNVGHDTRNNTTGTDIFCSSQLMLLTGSVFLAGGDNWTGTATTNTGNNNTNILDPDTNVLSRGLNMGRARWYSTATTLTNGDVYIQGGSSGTNWPEIRRQDGTFSRVFIDTSSLHYNYPRNFVRHDGKVWGFDMRGQTYLVDTAGSGQITLGPGLGFYTGREATVAMFRPGRLLHFGGIYSEAKVIDITGAQPVITNTQPLSSDRRLVTSTILADGQVLATGGSRVYNELTGVNYKAEIWNPETGQWLQGASGNRARLYHSMALLLPDASVMVGGGGAPGPQTNNNVEIYYPPYLFKSGGLRASRPTITLAPTALTIGKTFSVDVGNTSGISRVTLVKTGSVTHSFNMEQRFMDLTFTANGSRLTVQAPTRAGDATPGFYMLFVFDSAGVPSEAHIARIGVAANPNPSIEPNLTNPGNQSSAAGTATSLQLAASDPNGDTLIYSASGLPPGLTLNTGTGRISGTPSTAGSYNVAVTASDGVNADSASFVWTVTGGGGAPLEFDMVTVPSPLQSNGSASYTASATGTNVRYKWNFGDGTAETAWSTSASVSHTFTQPGTFLVTVTAIDAANVQQNRSFLQIVHLPLTANRPTVSSNLAFESPSSGNPRLWVVNQDNNSVSVFDAVTRAKLGETTVGTAPRSIAVAPGGMVWVTNRQSATISVINPATRAITRTIALPYGSMPFGIAMSPASGHAFVALEATGQLLKFDTASYAQAGSANVGANARHVSVTANGANVYVSRFITPPLPGEATATVAPTLSTGGEVLVVDAAAMNVVDTVVLRHSDKPDFEDQGRGIPNYLGAAAISPDGTQAWVPSKQDNVKRGGLRDGTGLNFQSTVRAISSRIVLSSGNEDYAKRVDHDNASVASAAVFDRLGVYLFVALETSREVAVINGHGGGELMRFDVGRAPQGLAVSADGKTLYVNNFMDRTVGVFDLRALVERGETAVTSIATLNAVGTEKLAANVLKGKQFFYDARDTRLARDRYMSCASCHNDGGHDGRVWDLTSQGEGLRNTINLRGRSGGQSRLHWSHNFDEVHDFEGQIRALAGGTGLMSDAAFNTGTRSQPLGDQKTGVSADLDALAAYVASLNRFDESPYRPGGALSATGQAGRTIFADRNCAGCHSGSNFTPLGAGLPSNIGTIKPSSGQRLGAALTSIDVQTLRDVWATAPYLHDGSAPTLEAAVRAHSGVVISDADAGALATYLREIGREEASAPVRAASTAGTGLSASYYNNTTLTGPAVLTRTEAVDFSWGTASPGSGINADNFSARWTGRVEAPHTGAYTFRTVSADGVRLRVNGVLIIDNWVAHGTTTDTSGVVQLVAGQRYDVSIEFFETTNTATMRLQWLTPGKSSFVAVPSTAAVPELTPRRAGAQRARGAPPWMTLASLEAQWQRAAILETLVTQCHGLPGPGGGNARCGALRCVSLVGCSHPHRPARRMRRR